MERESGCRQACAAASSGPSWPHAAGAPATAPAQARRPRRAASGTAAASAATIASRASPARAGRCRDRSPRARAPSSARKKRPLGRCSRRREAFRGRRGSRPTHSGRRRRWCRTTRPRWLRDVGGVRGRHAARGIVAVGQQDQHLLLRLAGLERLDRKPDGVADRGLLAGHRHLRLIEQLPGGREILGERHLHIGPACRTGSAPMRSPLAPRDEVADDLLDAVEALQHLARRTCGSRPDPSSRKYRPRA